MASRVEADSTAGDIDRPSDVYRFSPKHRGIHDLLSYLLPRMSILCGDLPQNNSHAGTSGTLGTYGSTLSADTPRRKSMPRLGQSALPRLRWACYRSEE